MPDFIVEVTRNTYTDETFHIEAADEQAALRKIIDTEPTSTKETENTHRHVRYRFPDQVKGDGNE